MLTGNALLEKFNELEAQGLTKSEIVRACGYEIDGKLKFTDFYTELFTVKGLISNDTSETEISEEYQEEYQKLCDSYGQDAVDAFLELHDEDLLEYFEEAYHGRYDSESDFAEQFTVDVYGFDAPSYVVIDWDATWNTHLRYDFDFEDGFVFFKNF